MFKCRAELWGEPGLPRAGSTMSPPQGTAPQRRWWHLLGSVYKEGQNHHKCSEEREENRNRVRGGREGVLQVLGQRLPWGTLEKPRWSRYPHCSLWKTLCWTRFSWRTAGRAMAGAWESMRRKKQQRGTFFNWSQPQYPSLAQLVGIGLGRGVRNEIGPGKIWGVVGERVVLIFLFDSHCPSLS